MWKGHLKFSRVNAQSAVSGLETDIEETTVSHAPFQTSLTTYSPSPTYTMLATGDILVSQ